VVDEYLSVPATTAITSAMMNGVDLTNTTCYSNPSTACPANTVRANMNDCVCVQGYTPFFL